MAETFTFSNGSQVGIIRMNPDLMRELRRKFPPPEPPVEHTELGDEPNATSPAYLRALADYNEDMGDRTFQLCILRGVWVEIDKEKLAQLREDARVVGLELPENDKITYVRYVLMSSAEDMRRLTQVVLGQIQPTEEEIGQAQAEFKSDVQG